MIAAIPFTTAAYLTVSGIVVSVYRCFIEPVLIIGKWLGPWPLFVIAAAAIHTGRAYLVRRFCR